MARRQSPWFPRPCGFSPFSQRRDMSGHGFLLLKIATPSWICGGFMVDICGQLDIYICTGWWFFATPLEKWVRQMGWWHFQLNGKIKTVPNYQPWQVTIGIPINHCKFHGIIMALSNVPVTTKQSWIYGGFGSLDRCCVSLQYMVAESNLQLRDPPLLRRTGNFRPETWGISWESSLWTF